MIYFLDPMKMLQLRMRFYELNQHQTNIDLFSLNFQVQSRGNLKEIEEKDLWRYLMKSIPYKLKISQIRQQNYSVPIPLDDKLQTEITLYPIFQKSLIEKLHPLQLNDQEIQQMKKLNLFADEYLCLRSIIVNTSSKLELTIILNSLSASLKHKYQEAINSLILYYFTNFHFEFEYMSLQISKMIYFKENLRHKKIAIIGQTWRNYLLYQYCRQLKFNVSLFRSEAEPKYYYSPTYLQNKLCLKVFQKEQIEFRDYKANQDQSMFQKLANIIENHDEEQAFKIVNEDLALFLVQNALTEFTTVKQLKQHLSSNNLNQAFLFNNEFQWKEFVRDVKSIKSIKIKNKIQVKCDSKQFEFDFLIFGDSNQFINSLIQTQSIIKDNPSFEPEFIQRIKPQFQGLKMLYTTKAICKFTSTFWPQNYIRQVFYDNSLMIIYDFFQDSLLIELQKPYKEVVKKFDQHKREIIKILQETFKDEINRENTRSIELFPCDYFIQSDFSSNQIFKDSNIYFNLPIILGNGINLLTQSILNAQMIIQDIYKVTQDPDYQKLKHEEEKMILSTFGLNVNLNSITLPYEFKKYNYILAQGNNKKIHFQSLVFFQSKLTEESIHYLFTIIEDNLQRKIYVLVAEDDQKNIIMERTLDKLFNYLFNIETSQKELFNLYHYVNPKFKFPNIYPELLLQGTIDNYATNEMIHKQARCCMGSLFIGLEHPSIKLLRKSMKYHNVKFPQYFNDIINKPIVSGKFELKIQFDNQLKITRRFLSTQRNEYQIYNIEINQNHEIYVTELDMTEKNPKEIWDQMYYCFLDKYNMKQFYYEMIEFIEGELKIINKFKDWNKIIQSTEQQRSFQPQRMQIAQSDLLYSTMKQDDTFEIVNGKLFYCQKGHLLNLKGNDFRRNELNLIKQGI
ncbi:unnamed protein product [Paramecium sonneborni]|uniref:Uncharacterized protein n=1 Tax=Paramecium sonneborni TaxID=65129 RepID=A0A8S1RGK7_9CILI|nr:unnamed protein product [Paramecium sonneborni]